MEFAKHEPDEFTRNEEELVALLTAGRATPHIGASFPLAEASAALAHVATGQAIGKVVHDLT